MIQMYSRPFSKQVDILPENGYILLMGFKKIISYTKLNLTTPAKNDRITGIYSLINPIFALLDSIN